MFPLLPDLRRRLAEVIANKTEQGHATAGLVEKLAALPDSYDRFYELALSLDTLPLRDDWPYVEPDDWEGIKAELHPARPRGAIRALDPAEAAARVETAFLSSVCGCMLGKPLEIHPTLADIRAGLEAIGEWPLNDYVSLRTKMSHVRPEAARENLRFAVPDDDVNYTVLGMIGLERFGLEFTHEQLRQLWLTNLSPYNTWGPERQMLVVGALRSIDWDWRPRDAAWHREVVHVLNPGDELCGALIRADAYGYASPCNPGQAAWLAWKDASFTHRRTGIYGTMFAAAAMAAAPGARTPLEIFEVAIQFVPQRSRFYRIVSDSLSMVADAPDWLEGYRRIHGKYKEYTHCRVFQECGTLINTLRFAENIGDGFCKQVMQGNDTDSFGATAGSILGLYFGPGHLEDRWLAPLNDTLHTTVADFHDQSLSRVAARMGKLARMANGDSLV